MIKEEELVAEDVVLATFKINTLDLAKLRRRRIIPYVRFSKKNIRYKLSDLRKALRKLEVEAV